MPAEPPDVDFLVADDPAGADEELPEPAGMQWWLRARLPLAGAAAVLLLTAVLFRVTSGGSDGERPAAAPGSDRPGGAGATLSVTFPPEVGDRIKMGSARIHTVPCDVLPQCIVTEGAPDAIVDALKEYLPGAHVIFASTSMDRTGIAGRHHRFRSTSVQARRGPVAIRITISRRTETNGGLTRAGERETAFGTRVFARAYFPGYFISVDITAPSGRGPTRVRDVLALATDDRLRPPD